MYYICSVHRITSTKKLQIYKYSCRCNGIKRGLDVDKILGIIFESGQRMFLVKWKTEEDIELVESYIMNQMYPQDVITYYEDIVFNHDELTFHHKKNNFFLLLNNIIYKSTVNKNA